MKKGFLLSPGTGKEEKKEEEIKKLNKAEPTPETNKAAPENNETLNKDKVKVSFDILHYCVIIIDVSETKGDAFDNIYFFTLPLNLIFC